VLAVWSVVPAYLIAGAFLGWLADRWLGTWPFGMAIGLIFALALAVRDIIRLRETL
jgi:F0F1-type ATP synthase assembly protein I